MRGSDVTMMTKRSNHMPMLTKMQTAMTIQRLRRAFSNQKTCGAATLQNIITQ